MNRFSRITAHARIPALIMMVIALLGGLITVAPTSITEAASAAGSPPVITNINPPSAFINGDTSARVVITGTGFAGTGQLFWAGTALPQQYFQVDSDTQISALVPVVTTPGNVNVQVQTDGGLSNLFPFTYYAIPRVNGLTPSDGPPAGGFTTVIAGQYLTGATSVRFGTQAATFTVDSDTQITATVPAMTTTAAVPVVVHTPSGDSNSTTFAYLAQPEILSVSPNTGATAGGSTVQISGSGFTTANKVAFGAQSSVFTIDSDTQITATLPAIGGLPGAPLAVGVSVTTKAGTATGAFTYLTPPPYITSVGPPLHGPLAGGYQVLIGGYYFSGATAVFLGGKQALIQQASDNFITVIVPAGNVGGPVPVTVVTSNGSSNTDISFVYDAPQPEVSSVSPSFGPASGGNTMVIRGQYFTAATSVKFGTTSAPSFTVDSDTQITATVPSNSSLLPIDVIVSVTTPSGQGDSTTKYHYSVPVPTIQSFSPTSGPLSGTQVVINGVGFTGATAVKFGTHSATFAVDSDGQITAEAPAVGAAESDAITVTAPYGEAVSTNAFSYVQPAPVIETLSPNSGSTRGGTPVVIRGHNFIGVTAVNFGSIALDSGQFTVDSDTQITANAPTIPDNLAATVLVIVTTGAGPSNSATFTFLAPPTVNSFAPTTGPLTGGTKVTLTGTNLTQVNGVYFGVLTATDWQLVSSTQITATVPAAEPPNVNVPVSVSYQPDPNKAPLSVAAPGTFRYVDVPHIQSFTPTTGPMAGGTNVVITGTDFTGATAVSFGTHDASTFHVDSDTQITVTSPPSGDGETDLISVTGPAGTGTSTTTFDYFIPAPTAAGFTPTSGPRDGGTAIILTGTNLSSVRGVSVGTAATFHLDSDTQITITTRASEAPNFVVDVVLVYQPWPTHTPIYIAAPGKFTFLTAPAITSLSPTHGPQTGGNSVTINGARFTGATSVTFDGVSVPFTVVNDGQITTQAPVHAQGTVDVVVVSPFGPSPIVAADRYAYDAPAASAPSISTLNVTSGAAIGGTAVKVTLTKAASVDHIYIDGVSVPFTQVNNRNYTFSTPAHAPGIVPIYLHNSSGNSNVVFFTYFPTPPPSNLSLDNTSGPQKGGTSIRLSGLYLNGTSSVLVDGLSVPFTTAIVNGAVQVRFVTPPHLPGTVQFKVATPNGSGTINFTYQATVVPAPGNLTLTPSTANRLAPTSIVLTGNNLFFVNLVTIRGLAVQFTRVFVNGAYELHFVAPPYPAGKTTVVVTNAGGTKSLSLTYQ